MSDAIERLRDKLAAAKADAAEFARLEQQARDRAARLERELAEAQAAAMPQAPAIPDDVLERAWNETLAVGRGFAYWSETRSQGDARAFAAAIAAHVVAQGTRVWVPRYNLPAFTAFSASHERNDFHTRPAVLLYTDGHP